MARASKAGPNRYPGRENAAAAGVCLFMGEEFKQDETVCWRDRKWRCDGGAWKKTEEHCAPGEKSHGG